MWRPLIHFKHGIEREHLMLNGTCLIPGAASTTKNAPSDESYSELSSSTVSVSISDEVYPRNKLTIFSLIFDHLNLSFGLIKASIGLNREKPSFLHSRKYKGD